MSQSTDAILVWGFDLGDPDDWNDDALRERVDYFQDEGYSELEALEKKTGAQLVQHCSSECPMYIIGASASKVRAWRGEPKEIDSLMLDVGEAQQSIDELARELGVKPEKGRWLLASDWS